VKPDLRAVLRRRRKALAPEARAAAQEAIAGHLDRLLVDAVSVGVYAAHGSELDLHGWVTRTSKIIAWPRVSSDGLTFATCPEAALVVGYRGLREPPAEAPLVAELDVILVPGLGFDAAGHRLGQGGGFYDRLLASLRSTPRAPLAVGVAFAAQLVDALPVDAWDQPVDALVSERGAVLIRAAP